MSRKMKGEIIMKCDDCGYYWQDEGDAFPCCHYTDSWPAPCELDEQEEMEAY